MSGMSCTFSGKVIADPVVKPIKNGQSKVMTTTVMYEEYDGKTNITRVVSYGKLADTFSQKIAKGQEVEVIGSVGLNTWQKDGQSKSGLCVTALKINPIVDDV